MVQFKSVRGDGTIKVVGTAKLVDGRVRITTKMEGFKEELARGVIGPKGKRFFPRDGARFLAALPVAYGGSRFFAEEVG